MEWEAVNTKGGQDVMVVLICHIEVMGILWF
jgi:hypothetical protein